MIFGDNNFGKRTSNGFKLDEIGNKLSAMFKKNRVASLASLAILIGSLSGISYLFLNQKTQEEYKKEAVNNITFPTQEIHYGHVSEDKLNLLKPASDLKIFISLNSKESRSAYAATKNFADKNNLDMIVYHLAQNPEWESSSKVFHAILSLNPKVDLLPYFDFMIKFDPKKNLLNEITPLLIEQEINTATFSNIINSIDVIKLTNKHIEFSNNLSIDFIPTIIIHDKYSIYFGSFISYIDSLRLFNALKNPMKDVSKPVPNITTSTE